MFMFPASQSLSGGCSPQQSHCCAQVLLGLEGPRDQQPNGITEGVLMRSSDECGDLSQVPCQRHVQMWRLRTKLLVLCHWDVTGPGPTAQQLRVEVQGRGRCHRYPGAEPGFGYKYCGLITQHKGKGHDVE